MHVRLSARESLPQDCATSIAKVDWLWDRSGPRQLQRQSTKTSNHRATQTNGRGESYVAQLAFVPPARLYSALSALCPASRSAARSFSAAESNDSDVAFLSCLSKLRSLIALMG